MSLFRRRMMMQTAQSEPIPRERIVFSHAGDLLVTGVTKTNDGDAICGLAVIRQSMYNAQATPYWVYLLLVSKAGRNYSAVVASAWCQEASQRFTDPDRVEHTISSTKSGTPAFDTVENAVAYLRTVNVNNLPILNVLTGKEYVGSWTGYCTYHSIEAAQDLLNYYKGVV